MRAKLKKFILKTLDEMGGTPLSEQSICEAVRMVWPDLADGETLAAIRDLDGSRYITGSSDDLTQVKFWTLTMKGKLASA